VLVSYFELLKKVLMEYLEMLENGKDTEVLINSEEY